MLETTLEIIAYKEIYITVPMSEYEKTELLLDFDISKDQCTFDNDMLTKVKLDEIDGRFFNQWFCCTDGFDETVIHIASFE